MSNIYWSDKSDEFFYDIKCKQQLFLNIDYMRLHICLQGKLRVCRIQRPYAIFPLLPFFLSGPFDEIQFDGPNRSKRRGLTEES